MGVQSSLVRLFDEAVTHLIYIQVQIIDCSVSSFVWFQPSSCCSSSLK
jgi:hypothetical protein